MQPDTSEAHIRYPVASITWRVILLFLTLSLFGFTFTQGYRKVFVNYPFIIIIWVSILCCGLILSRVLDNDTFRTGSVVAAHLLIQSGVVLGGGFSWHMNMYIILIEFVFFLVGVIVTHSYLASPLDVPLSSVIIYAFLGLFLYVYVARVLDLQARSSFILTSRLKKERIDMHMQLEGIKIFDAADKMGRTRALDVVIDPNAIVLGPTLGAGSFGEVRKADWQHTPVAVKNIHGTYYPFLFIFFFSLGAFLSIKTNFTGNAVTNKKILAQFHEEATVMSKLRHPNVVQFLGVCVHPPMLVMELMPRGSVFHILQNKEYELDWTLLIQFALDSASG